MEFRPTNLVLRCQFSSNYNKYSNRMSEQVRVNKHLTNHLLSYGKVRGSLQDPSTDNQVLYIKLFNIDRKHIIISLYVLNHLLLYLKYIMNANVMQRDVTQRKNIKVDFSSVTGKIGKLLI